MERNEQTGKAGIADEQRRCSVYCIYFPNGKRYVGVESRKGRRISDHARMASIRDKGCAAAQVVHLAIRKHGWGNVRWRYLTTNCTATEAYALERTFIRLFQTQNVEWGYNRSEGGEENRGYKRRPESSERHRTTLAAKSDGGAGHLRSPEIVAKRAKTRKDNGGYGPPPDGCVNTKPNSTSFKAGQTPWNKGRSGGSSWNAGLTCSDDTKSKIAAAKRANPDSGTSGRVCLPAGPNGERRYFRPEQLI